MIDSKYLEFVEVPWEGKTRRFNILSKRNGEIIGRIQWYPQWRQYTFDPGFPTTWNVGCLNDIIKVIESLMREREWNKALKDAFDKDGKCLKCGAQGELAPGIGYYCPKKGCGNREKKVDKK